MVASTFTGLGVAVDADYVGFALHGFRRVAHVVGDASADNHFVADVQECAGGVFLIAEIEGTVHIELSGAGAIVRDVEGGVTVLCAELLSDGNDFSLDIDVFGAFFTVGECGSILVGCNAVEGVGSGSVAGCLSFFASAGLFSAGGHAVEGVNEGFALCGFRCVSFEVHDRAADDDFVARFDLRVSFGEFFVAEVVGAIDIELVFGGAVIGDVEGGVTIVGGEFLLDGNHDAFDIDSGRVHVSFE